MHVILYPPRPQRPLRIYNLIKLIKCIFAFLKLSPHSVCFFFNSLSYLASALAITIKQKRDDHLFANTIKTVRYVRNS